MPLDPEVQKWLQQVASAATPAWETIPVEQARELMQAASALMGPVEAVAKVDDLSVPSPGGDIPLRLYNPSGGDRLATIVFFHGGGWVVGGIDTHDGFCRSLANAAQMMVASVDYRLAPEHRYPAAADDAYEATCWLARHGAEVGVDGSRLAVAGDSAGGNLAAVTALRARDEQDGPALRMQVLLYPIVDHNFDTDSYLRNMSGFHLTRDTMIWFWDQYVPEHSQRDEPYASPLRAADLSNLPPAMVVTAEFDPLLDEGELYARRLESAGVPVQLRRVNGTIHGFARRLQLWAHARETLQEMAAALKSAMQ